MASAGDSFKIEKLTVENYHSWKFNIKMSLIGKDLWEIVQGTETLAEDDSAEEQRKFKKRENLALASVCLSVTTPLQIYVRSAKSAKEAWDNLQKQFEAKSRSKKIFYRRKLYSTRMQKGTDMTEHINFLKTIADQLEAVEDPVSEEDLVIISISSLPDEYNYLITALETIAEDKLTFNYVRDRLIHENDKLKNEKADDFLVKPSSSNQDALFTKGSKKSADTKKIKCFYCKKKGHMAKDCFKKKADMKKNKEIEEKSSNG